MILTRINGRRSGAALPPLQEVSSVKLRRLVFNLSKLAARPCDEMARREVSRTATRELRSQPKPGAGIAEGSSSRATSRCTIRLAI